MKSSRLRIVAFSDWRVQDIDLLIDFLYRMNEKPDIIFYAGDDIRRFVETDISSLYQGKVPLNTQIKRNWFEEISSYSEHGLCAVIGNDDLPITRELIQGKTVYNVHKKPFIIREYSIIGIEGAEYDPGVELSKLGYTLDIIKIRKHLQRLSRKNKRKKIIILSHSPPRNTLDLASRFGNRRIGSKALREFIDKNTKKVPLVVCGHVHIQGGVSIQLRETTIVNVASHDDKGAPGKIAVIDISKVETRIKWHDVQPLGIYEVNGIGPTRYQKLKQAGILTLDQLLATDVEKISTYLGCSLQVVNGILIRAKAVDEKRIIPIGAIPQVEQNAAFLDIETDLNGSLVWLIGIYFLLNRHFDQLVAENRSQEKSTLEKFFGKISSYTGKIYTFSGTRFDERVLKKRFEYYGLDTSKLPEFIDLGILIKQSIAFPLKSYGLKSIANLLGFKYRHPNLDGLSVASKYLGTYQVTKDKKLMKQFLEYNEDDIRCLPWIIEKLFSLCKGS